MMADFMNQDMADEVGQILAGLAPVVEQRPAVQVDHVRSLGGAADALVARSTPRQRPSRSNGEFEAHFPLGFLVGEILDMDHHVAHKAQQLGGMVWSASSASVSMSAMVGALI